MPGPTSYLYKSSDDPITLAQANGLTTQQLLAANPGGYPFQTGQAINLPYQYSAPAGPQLPNATNPQGGVGTTPYGPVPPTVQPPPAGYGPNYAPTAPNRNTFFNSEKGAPSVSSTYGTDDSWYRTPAQAAASNRAAQNLQAGTATQSPIDPTKPFGGFQNKGGADNTDYANTAIAQYYEATGTPFLQQKRWDPDKKKYISIGQWLKQGRRRGGRGRGGGGGGRSSQQQRRQEYALANSIIDFGVSAG